MKKNFTLFFISFISLGAFAQSSSKNLAKFQQEFQQLESDTEQKMGQKHALH